MLPKKLEHYLQAIEIAIKSLQSVYAEKYVEEIFTNEQVNLRIRLRFNSGHLLEMHEAIIYKNAGQSHERKRSKHA